MPVDEDVNLDNPEGITQDDLDRMEEEADRLEEIAEKAETNAEKVAKAKKELEGLNFAQLNILDKTLDTSTGGGTGINNEQLATVVAEIYEQLEGAKSERAENKKKISEAEQAILDNKKAISEARTKVGETQGVVGEINSFRASPVGMAKGKLLGMVGKLGVYGIIAQFVIQMAEQTFNQIMTEIKAQFKAGGVFDTRKMVQDQLLEYNTISYLTRLRSGQVFFTADAGQDLRQGAPRGSNNTRDLRDGHLRFIQFHAGI